MGFFRSNFSRIFIKPCRELSSSDRLRIEVEPVHVEFSGSLEPSFVPEPACITLDLPDYGIEALRTGAFCAGEDCGQAALKEALDPSSHFLDGFEPRANLSAIPVHPGPTHPGSGSLQIGKIKRPEMAPTLVGHVEVFQPEAAASGKRRFALAGEQHLVLGSSDLVDRVTEMPAHVELVKGDLRLGNVRQRRIDERSPQVHGHCLQTGQRLGCQATHTRR